MKSRELAELIVNCGISYKENDELYQTNELVRLIHNKDIENLSYWLEFHSFIKFQIRKNLQVISGIDLKKPNEEVVQLISLVLKNYLAECSKKAQLKKYVLDDFLVTQDFAEFITNLESFRNSVKPDSGAKIRVRGARHFVYAKNRRNKILNRHFSAICIEASERQDKQLSFEKLITKILSLKRGSRKQIVYFHDKDVHAIGFDIQIDQDGKINIFCFDSTGDVYQLDTLEKVYAQLEQSGNQFELKACQAKMQRDDYNCSYYVIASLNEFAKYDNVFDYLPEKLVEDLSPKNTKVASREAGWFSADRQYQFNNLHKITWIKFSDMPTKIVSMSQSYEQLHIALGEKKAKQTPEFDEEVKEFVVRHKKKYEYDDNNKDIKYINKRREKIYRNIAESTSEISKIFYQKKLQDYPIVQAILNAKIIDYHQYIEENKLSLSEIERLFTFILAKNGVINIFCLQEMSAKFTDAEIEALFYLRYEYLRMLFQLNPEETVVEIKKYTAIIMEQDVQPLERCFQKQLEKLCFPSEVLSMKEAANKLLSIEKRIYIFRNLQGQLAFLKIKIDNPLLPLVKTETELSEETILTELLNLENSYKDHLGESLVDDQKKFELIMEALLEASKIKNHHKIAELRKAYLNLLSQMKKLNSNDVCEKLFLLIRNSYHGSNEKELFDDLASYFKPRDILYFIKPANSNYITNFPSIEQLIVFIVGDGTKKLTISEILDFISCCDDLVFQLAVLEKIFLSISSKEICTRSQSKLENLYGKFWAVPYSKIQLDNIRILQETCIKLIKDSKSLTEKLIQDQLAGKLINFSYPERKVSEAKINIQNILATKSQEKISEEKKELTSAPNKFALNQILTPREYYEKFSNNVEAESTSLDNNNSIRMNQFSTDEVYKDTTKWFQFYKSSWIPSSIDDWKFNLAVHYEDLPLALEIFSDIARKYDLAIYKVMSQLQAKCSAPTMRGREIVIYCHYNPEIKPAEWLKLIHETEEQFNKHNIRPSVDKPPTSNKGIGNYASYTHESWTRYDMYTPFDFGIKQQAMEDEDPFLLRP